MKAKYGNSHNGIWIGHNNGYQNDPKVNLVVLLGR